VIGMPAEIGTAICRSASGPERNRRERTRRGFLSAPGDQSPCPPGPGRGSLAIMREPTESRSLAIAALEGRVRRLEAWVAALAEAAEVLARGLEGGPLEGPTHRSAEQAARQARELLLSARPGRLVD
jgi:hypothetical protein